MPIKDIQNNTGMFMKESSYKTLDIVIETGKLISLVNTKQPKEGMTERVYSKTTSMFSL